MINRCFEIFAEFSQTTRYSNLILLLTVLLLLWFFVLINCAINLVDNSNLLFSYVIYFTFLFLFMLLLRINKDLSGLLLFFDELLLPTVVLFNPFFLKIL